MNELREILDRIAKLVVMFLAIINDNDRKTAGEKLGGIAWQGPKDQLAVWLALNMQINPDVKDIILNATNVYLNRYKEGKKVEDDLEIYNLKIYSDKQEGQ